MPELLFDEKQHRYTFDGRPLVGVTEALTGCGLIDKRWFDEYSATRGQYVHKACALLDSDQLDESTVDPAIAGYLEAYEKFLGHFEPQWTEIEKPHYCEIFGFAGTPDRASIDMVLDIKTGAPADWHGYQLAAYNLLLRRHNRSKRMGLYLHEDGTYRTQTYSNRFDFDVFQAALTIQKAKGAK